MQPSQQLVNEVRAGFILQGSSLHKFCRDNNLDNGNIQKYLRGDYTGEKATAAIEPVIKAALPELAGLEPQPKTEE